ncbi:MAG: hypothetical protein QXV17_10725 [Candidatus Micrarchaeaceae archaeon]
MSYASVFLQQGNEVITEGRDYDVLSPQLSTLLLYELGRTIPVILSLYQGETYHIDGSQITKFSVQNGGVYYWRGARPVTNLGFLYSRASGALPFTAALSLPASMSTPSYLGATTVSSGRAGYITYLQAKLFAASAAISAAANITLYYKQAGAADYLPISMTTIQAGQLVSDSPIEIKNMWLNYGDSFQFSYFNGSTTALSGFIGFVWVVIN